MKEHGDKTYKEGKIVLEINHKNKHNDSNWPKQKKWISEDKLNRL